MGDLWLAAIVVYLIAGTVKGTVGIGLPTAGIGLMSQFTEPRTAIALAIIPMIVTNVWQIIRSGHVVRTMQRYWPFASSLCVFIYVSSGYARVISAEILLVCIGVAVVLFSVDALWRKPFVLPQKFDTPVQFSCGALGGMMGGVAGIWSPMMVSYLIARQVDKDEFVRALGFLILSGSLFLCLGYWHAGLLTGPLAQWSATLIIPALVGYAAGEFVRRRLGADRFKTAVLVLFLIMGLNLIRRGVWY